MHTIAMACATWTGKGKPTQAELDAREVREAYDPLARELRPVGPFALVGSTPTPKRWVKLGKVKRPNVDVPLLPGGTSISPRGRKRIMPSYAGFTGLLEHAQRAFAMARDRKGVIAAELAADAAIDAHDAAEDAKDAIPIEARKRATLAELATLELLPEWKGLVAARHRRSVTKLLAACVAQLDRNASRAAKLAVIEKTVEAINAWNDRTQVIETPEREAVCTAIDDIGRAVGLRGRDLAGPYRDW